MAEFRRAVLTQKGLALLAKAQADGSQVILTRCVSGAGTYEEGEAIEVRTALKDLRQSFAPSSIRRQNDVNVWVRFNITNNPPSGPLTRGYTVSEVGIIARDPDEGEILYSLAVAESGQGDYLPAYNDQMPAVIGMNYLIEVANAEEVIINTDLSAYVTRDEVDEIIDIMNGEEESTTTFPAANTIVERTSSGTKTTEFMQDGSIRETYPSGKVFITSFLPDGSIVKALAETPEEEEEVES